MTERAVIGGLVVLVLALAGCTGDDDDDEASLADVAAQTREAATALTELTSELAMEREGHEGDLELSGEGAVDFGASRARATLASPMTGLELGQVIDGDVLYQQQQVPERGPVWVRQERQVVPALATLEASMDPLALLEAVSAAGDEAEDLGTEPADGDELQGHALSLSAGELGADGALADLAVDVQVWVDEDARVRRLVQAFDLAELFEAVESADEPVALQPVLAELAEMGGVAGTATTTLTLADFGADVDITPPTEDVVTPEELDALLAEDVP